jgi:polar amino acid transport system substrate-binding protein
MSVQARRTRLTHRFLMLLLGFFSSIALAGPVNCGNKPIRLAFYDFGYLYYTDGDVAKGIDKDVADELIKRSGCKFDTLTLARARIWSELASGDLDMSVSGIQNPERDGFAWFAHYLGIKNLVILPAHVAVKVHSAADFLKQSQLQFGAVRAFKHGTVQDKLLNELRSHQRVQDSANVEALFKKLKAGTIDALFSQPLVYRKHMADLGMQNEVVVQDWSPGDRGVPHGLILAKTRFKEEDAKQWQALITSMRDDGTLKRIYSKYLTTREAAELLTF